MPARCIRRIASGTPGRARDRLPTYDNGVLEVTVSLNDKADEKSQRRIPVMQNQHIDPR
jgi:hypothetical protein